MLCVPTSSQIEDGNFETFFIFLFFICMLSMRSDPYSLIFFFLPRPGDKNPAWPHHMCTNAQFCDSPKLSDVYCGRFCSSQVDV